MNDNEDDPFAGGRVTSMLQGMDAEERTAFIARALINAAFQSSDLPEGLRQAPYAAADRLAEETTLEPDAVAVEAFRQHGYRAEMKDMGGVAMLRATRVQG